MSLWGRRLPSSCSLRWFSWMEVSAVAWPLCQRHPGCTVLSQRVTVLFPCSHSALRAPAVPRAARGKQLGGAARAWPRHLLPTAVFTRQSQKGTPLTTLLKDPYILIAAGGCPDLGGGGRAQRRGTPSCTVLPRFLPLG